MNPKQSCLSHCAFFEWTAFSDKRFDKIAENKSGAAVSPLGGLHLSPPTPHNRPFAQPPFTDPSSSHHQNTRASEDPGAPPRIGTAVVVPRIGVAVVVAGALGSRCNFHFLIHGGLYGISQQAPGLEEVTRLPVRLRG